MESKKKTAQIINFSGAFNQPDEYGHLLFIQTELESVLEQQFLAQNLNSHIKKVLDYALFPGGKRIRPMLALALCQDMAPKNLNAYQQLLQLVFALELLHCASLLHDDLPALDNDNMRRGRPACHIAFGEASAILAADCMLPLAFQIISNSLINANQKALLTNYLSKSYIALCEGQLLDILGQESVTDILNMQSLKTGALFGAALVFAGVVLQVTDQQLDKMYSLGIKIGSLFQLQDDLLDISPEKGRGVNSDEKNQKITLLQCMSQVDLDKIYKELTDSIWLGLADLKETVSTNKQELVLTKQILKPMLSH